MTTSPSKVLRHRHWFQVIGANTPAVVAGVPAATAEPGSVGACVTQVVEGEAIGYGADGHFISNAVGSTGLSVDPEGPVTIAKATGPKPAVAVPVHPTPESLGRAYALRGVSVTGGSPPRVVRAAHTVSSEGKPGGAVWNDAVPNPDGVLVPRLTSTPLLVVGIAESSRFGLLAAHAGRHGMNLPEVLMVEPSWRTPNVSRP